MSLRMGLRVSVAAAVAAVSAAVLAVSATVSYPGAGGSSSTTRLGLTVDSAVVLACRVEVSPELAVSAQVLEVKAANYGIQAAYVVPAVSAEVSVGRARPDLSAVEISMEAEPQLARHAATAQRAIAAVEAAEARIASFSYEDLLVSAIETSLAWAFEFADQVVVVDEALVFRDVQNVDGTVIAEEFAISFGRPLADAAPAVDAVALDTSKPFADTVTTTDLMRFGLFIELGIDATWTTLPATWTDWTTWNRETQVLVTDYTLLVHLGKNLSEVVTLSEAIDFFDIGKVLTDDTQAMDAHAFSLDRGVSAESVVANDFAELSFNYFRALHDGINSALNGAPLNDWVLNANDTGETVFSTDFVLLGVGKALADAVTSSEAINFFYIGKVLTDTPVVLDPLSVFMGKPLPDTVTALDQMVASFVYLLEIHDGITSSLNGSALNQWELNGSDTGDWLFATDQSHLNFGKVFADSHTAADAINAFEVGKVLTDAPTLTEALVFDLSMPMADTVTAMDAVAVGFVYERRLNDGITSALNGAPLNQWVWNADDTGDWLMPSDWIGIGVGKALPDSAVASEAFDRTATFVRSVADSAAASEAMTAPLIHATWTTLPATWTDWTTWLIAAQGFRPNATWATLPATWTGWTTWNT